MRIPAVILALLLFWSFAQAQQRYVVGESGEMVPIKKGGSAIDVIRKQANARTAQPFGTTCLPNREYGNIPARHSFGNDVSFTLSHKDIMAIWFEAPASGTLDSVFIVINDHIGDTLTTGGRLFLRIHRSNIYSGHAPGWNPYIAPPKVCWGYFNSTFDLDAGLAAFQDDASDTNWVSSYKFNNTDGSIIYSHYGEQVDTTIKTFAPTAEEIWGLGGVEVPIKLHSISGISLGTLPPKPVVTQGYPFFISYRIPGANTPSGHPWIDPGPPYVDPTIVTVLSSRDPILGNDLGDGNPDPTIRRTATNWKFYEHASFCGPGWLARGGVSMFIYYTLLTTSDVPPNFISIDNIGNTTDEIHARTVQADIEDCNFTPGGTAEVASASLSYSVSDGPFLQIPMTRVGGSVWQGDIPALLCGNFVRYKITATDINGNSTTSEPVTYRVLCMRSDSYAADTGATRTYSGSLSTDGGIPIDTSAFIAGRTHTKPPIGNRVNKDDGTAGPFAISNGFVFFGDTMRYAWIGINGAISLSKTATDTINVNIGGSFGLLDFPSKTRKPYPDTLTNEGTPRNLIAAFWSDLILGDTLGQYGHIYYKDEADRFMVEWDSLGNFNTSGAMLDFSAFRLVLNKNNGIIEVQYNNVGVSGLDSNATVAVQSDSGSPNQRHGYFLIHQNATPAETKPRSNWAVSFWPVQSIAVADGWNLVSAPGTSWNMNARFLFNTAISGAFTFFNTYYVDSVLVNGRGYFMKFGYGPVHVPAGFVTSASVSLAAGWNMIGSVTSPVGKSSLTITPPGLINTSAIYGYSGGYSAASSTIDPGKGYWVKATSAGILNLGSGSAAPKAQPAEDFNAMNQITVGSGSVNQSLYLAAEGSLKYSVDSYELPPAVPNGFDARFASGRMVETYTNSDASYRIGLAFPEGNATTAVTVSWSMKNAPEGRTFVMTDGENGKVIGKVIMQGSGSVRIENSAVKTLVIKAETGIAVPSVFALSQNYPNPFNPTTRMQLDVPQTGQVTVAVFDVLGRKVATLVDGVTEAGYHVIEWNGMNSQGYSVPTGTYFVRINAGEFTQVRKIMMMK